MTTPEPLEVPPAPPTLQWQLGTATNPDGTTLCILKIGAAGGLLTTQLALNPSDANRLGQQLQDTATQARTGLIIPTVVMPKLNGSG